VPLAVASPLQTKHFAGGIAGALRFDMRPEDLRVRTKQFALRVIELWRRLPASKEYQEIGDQLRRAANAVASNYRAARCGRSHAEFTAKLGTVHEEADECQHHLDMLSEIGLNDEDLEWLRREASELVAILTTSLKTAKRRRGHPVATRPNRPDSPPA
jgi:four helix bundle protein